jgi:hypothetical protein
LKEKGNQIKIKSTLLIFDPGFDFSLGRGREGGTPAKSLCSNSFLIFRNVGLNSAKFPLINKYIYCVREPGLGTLNPALFSLLALILCNCGKPLISEGGWGHNLNLHLYSFLKINYSFELITGRHPLRRC